MCNQLIHRIVQHNYGQGPFRGPRLAARDKMDPISEKSIFDDQNDISNGNLSEKCLFFFKNSILPVLRSTQKGVSVIKNSSFLHHFWSFSPFKIVFWLYIVKKRSYDKMDTIFEKYIFDDQNDISNGNLSEKCFFFKNSILPVLRSTQRVFL